MKKKVFCALLCTAMVASLTACGGSSSSTAADTSSDAAAEETTEAADDTAEADTADAAADTAADTAGDQSFAVRRCLLTGRSGLTKSPDDRQQCDRTDDISNGIEGKASNIVHADALCDKSHTPDGGGQQKQKRIPDRNRFFFHNISPRSVRYLRITPMLCIFRDSANIRNP